VTVREIVEDPETDLIPERDLLIEFEDAVGIEITVTGEKIPMTMIGIQDAMGTLLTRNRETEVMIVAENLLIEHPIPQQKM